CSRGSTTMVRATPSAPGGHSAATAPPWTRDTISKEAARIARMALCSSEIRTRPARIERPYCENRGEAISTEKPVEIPCPGGPMPERQGPVSGVGIDVPMKIRGEDCRNVTYATLDRH